MDHGNLRLSRYIVSSERIFDDITNSHSRVLFGTRVSTVIVVDELTWQRLCTGAFHLLSHSDIDELLRAKILVPHDECELSTVISENHEALASDRELYQVIQPTAWCQLGCAYCGQAHQRTNMTSTEQAHLLDHVSAKLRGRDLDSLRICWFGAEPLAGLSVIRQLSPALQLLAQTHGLTYRASIVTNGLALSEKVSDELVLRHSVDRIEVTLDGPPNVHDGRRHEKSGRPTFARILHNIQYLARQTYDVSVTIRCNVDASNASDVTPLIRILRDANLAGSVTFYTAPIHSWGNDADSSALTPAEYANREINWLIELKQAGFPIQLIPSRRPIVCMAVRPSADVVDARGNIYSCTEIPYVPMYESSEAHKMGNVNKQGRARTQRPFAEFNSQVAEGKYDCSDCEMLPVCGGACPRHWMEGRVPCPAAKHNMAERLLVYYAFDRLSEPSAGEVRGR